MVCALRFQPGAHPGCCQIASDCLAAASSCFHGRRALLRPQLGLGHVRGVRFGRQLQNSSSAGRGEPPRPGAVPAGMEEGSSGEAQKSFIEAHKHCRSPAQPPGVGHRVDGQTRPAASRAGPGLLPEIRGAGGSGSPAGRGGVPGEMRALVGFPQLVTDSFKLSSPFSDPSRTCPWIVCFPGRRSQTPRGFLHQYLHLVPSTRLNQLFLQTHCPSVEVCSCLAAGMCWVCWVLMHCNSGL